MDAASSSGKPYFSKSTSSSGQRLSDLMCRSSPARVKNSRLRLPPVATFFGIRPTSSIISARWSSSRSYASPDRGSNSRSPVASSNTRHAADQTSAAVPYLAPRITSGHRYCRVWMSCVNCLYVQHAFPRSTTRHSTPRSSAAEGVGPRPRDTTARRGFPPPGPGAAESGSESDAPGAVSGPSPRVRSVSASSRRSERASSRGLRGRPPVVDGVASSSARASAGSASAASASAAASSSRVATPDSSSFSTHRATAAATTASIASAAPSVFASASASASAMMASRTSPGASAAHRASEIASPSANASSKTASTAIAAALSAARFSSQEVSLLVSSTFSGFRSVWMIFLRACR